MDRLVGAADSSAAEVVVEGGTGALTDPEGGPYTTIEETATLEAAHRKGAGAAIETIETGGTGTPSLTHGVIQGTTGTVETASCSDPRWTLALPCLRSPHRSPRKSHLHLWLRPRPPLDRYRVALMVQLVLVERANRLPLPRERSTSAWLTARSRRTHHQDRPSP